VNSTERFESAVIDELIPLIDSTYKTFPKRESRMVFGYSMGGFGALRYGLVYSDLFSSCALLSPALYNEAPPEGSSARTTGSFGTPFNIKQWDSLNYPASLKTFVGKNLKEFFFIGSGDDDWNNTEGVEYNIEYQSLLLYENVHNKLGLPAELRIINGDHSWKVWEPLFTEAIQLMMKYREQTLK
jgi:enterochelin esterase-like enzyme